VRKQLLASTLGLGAALAPAALAADSGSTTPTNDTPYTSSAAMARGLLATNDAIFHPLMRERLERDAAAQLRAARERAERRRGRACDGRRRGDPRPPRGDRGLRVGRQPRRDRRRRRLPREVPVLVLHLGVRRRLGRPRRRLRGRAGPPRRDPLLAGRRLPLADLRALAPARQAPLAGGADGTADPT
jgi:hypothetical protein